MKSVKNVFAISFLILGFLVFTLILVSCNRDSEGFVFEESESTATVIGYKGRNEHITIPSSYNGKPATAIGDSAFDINENKRVIKSVMIPNTIKTIGKYAFFGCELTSIIIPKNVTYLGDGAFSFCELTTIDIPGSIEILRNMTFIDCRSLTTVNIGEGVRVIKEQAFQGCTSLESISLPDSIERVEGYLTFKDTPWYAKLEENRKGKLIYIGKTLYCDNNCLDSVINIRDDTVFIKDQAFAYNDWVKEIRIPISVLMIGAGAFNRVENLTDVYYEGTKKQWNNIKICGGNEPLLNATINYNE